MSDSVVGVPIKRTGRILARASGVLVLLLALLEIALRLVGVLDFPLYLKDEQLGYIQQPSQSGHFLRRFDWRINSLQMFGEEYRPGQHPSLLLIGDSLVWGGNNYRLEERLGVALGRTLRDTSVWSVGAGSWSSWSEVEYMRRHLNVSRDCDYLVWLVNAGDLAERTSWTSELTHPTRRPRWATGYVLRKFVFPRIFPAKAAGGGGPALREDAFENVKAHLAALLPTKKRIIVLCYPARPELDASSPEGLFFASFVRRLRTLERERLVVLDVRADARWDADAYRDEIHPNAQGNQELARLIAANLDR